MPEYIHEKLRIAERNAIVSSSFGVSGELILCDSAVIILYSQALGAGDTLALMTTSVLPLLNGLFIIPFAVLAASCNKKVFVIRANLMALAGYITVVLAASFTGYGTWGLMCGLLLFSVCQTAFVAGWFPLLESFLPPNERSLFLGRMRFCHQIAALSFLALTGFIAGNRQAIHILQIILLLGAIVFSGRIFFVWRIPDFPAPCKENLPWLLSIRTAFRNRKLLGFAIYSFLFNFSFFATVPLIILYLKQSWMLSDKMLILISAMAFSGMLGGYALAHRLKEVFGSMKSLSFFHLAAIVTQTGLMLIPSGGDTALCLIIPLLVTANFCIAANSVVGNAEMMKLAPPEIKTIGVAFSGAFYYGGAGLGRLLSSFLLGLLISWQSLPGTVQINPYKTLLLFLLVLCSIGFLVLKSLSEESPSVQNPAQENVRSPEQTV